MTLTPPARVHGEAVADHMAAMIGAARQQNDALRTHVVERRHASSLRERVEDALLGLVRAADPLEWIGAELALTLGVDAAHLCLDVPRPWCRTLPSGTARVLLGGREVVLRHAPGALAALHGEAAPLVRTDALVRVAPSGAPVGLLALGSRDEAALAGGCEAPLALLGRAVAAALERPTAQTP